MEQLKFSSISSFVDSSFFTKLAELKLNKFKLDSTNISITGNMTNPNRLNKFNTEPILNLDYGSFDKESPSDDNILFEGSLYNVNTIEDFKNVDKQNFLKEAGLLVLRKLKDVEEVPRFEDVNPFSILTFSDLKKYKFYYWLAYPVLNSTWLIKNRENVSTVPASISGTDSALFYLVGNGDFVFTDTSFNVLPSAQLKNYLYFLALKGHREIRVFIMKPQNSFKLTLVLDESSIVSNNTRPKITGWERTSSGKLGPKVADLGSLINPRQLAEQAVDLNLKLMKWRIAPNINLDIIKQQKVLLLGAGTLGSYVSRALMGWGVRKITFVDNGRISYSNPVRQPLFLFNDCFSDEGRGEWKAIRGAQSLREIFPGVESEGFNLEVPMIGHPVGEGDSESLSKRNFKQLESLINSHDVIFLLMDSRESRWLPTVLGLSMGKLVLNAALGFDSYLVMRHGNLNSEGNDYNGRLGCYYCNDVVAPDDSLSDRTLDQMCTVTRPGGALIASSLAVELFVSTLQHPEGKNSPSSGSESVIGEVPHQIRGFLHNFQQTKLMSPSFKNCSACSMSVLKHFQEGGWEFIKNCLNDSKYLEEVSGLAKVQEEAELGAEELLKDLELSDEDEEWLS